MPAAVAAVASMAASSYVGALVGGGILGAVASFATGMIVSNLVGGLLGADKKPQQQVDFNPPAQAERGVLVNTAGTVDPIAVVYGKRRVGGTRLLTEVSGGNNAYLHLVVVHAEGESDGIDAVYFDNTVSTDGRFAGHFTLEHFMGTDGQAACASLMTALPEKWTSAHRVAGCAYTYARLTYNANAWSGLPTITVDLRGRKVYDPRTGLTAWSDNPALCLRDYLTNARYGRGIPDARVLDDSFIAAANYCDELVSTPDGNRKRYTCNAYLNPDDGHRTNTLKLLSGMRGMLVETAHGFRLVLDKPEVPEFTFNEDNITGAWSIKLSDKRTRFNRVRGQWINPDNEWQPDLALADSASYRAADNGLMLETKLDLPCTTDAYQAQLIAQRHLKQSRFGTIVSFRATIAGLDCAVADVVYLTHSTPGYDAKPFRILKMGLLSSDEIEVVALEYDDAVYEPDPLTAPRVSAATNLPDPHTVAIPGTPAVTEALYETTGSAGAKAKATVSWAASDDAFVIGYEPAYRLAGAASWTALPMVNALSVDLFDIAPGSYEFRVRALNAIGARSGWSGTRAQEIRGLTAAPATPTGFYLVASDGGYEAEWALATDLDVRLGGRAVIRHSTLTSGATWNDGIVVKDAAGGETSARVPLMAGTYLIKFQDSSGNWSATPATFVPSEALLTGYTTVATSTQHAGFAGAKSNVAVLDGALRLDSASTVGSMTTPVSEWPKLSSLGGISGSGSYAFDGTLDLGSVAARRFDATITAQSFDTGDLISFRGPVSGWDSVSGDVINDCDATLFIRTTDDDPSGSPAWGPWTPFFVGDFACRAAQFRLDLASGSPTHNLAVSALSVRARIPA